MLYIKAVSRYKSKKREKDGKIKEKKKTQVKNLFNIIEKKRKNSAYS